MPRRSSPRPRSRRALAQSRSSLRLHVLEPVLGHVPLGQDDDGRALCLARHIGDGEVALGDSLQGVDEHERDVRPLRRLERAQLRPVLDPLTVLALRRIPAVSTSTNVVSSRRSTVSIASRVVPGTSETMTRSSPTSRFRSERLADVRSAEDGDADRVLHPRAAARSGSGSRSTTSSRRSPVPWPWRLEIANGSPRPSRWNSWITSSRRRVVDLVRDEQHRLARAAEQVGDLLVARRDPLPRVDEEEHEVGLLDRGAGLLGDPLRDRRGVGHVDRRRCRRGEARAPPLAH